MKVILDIPESELRNAVEAQVGAQLALITQSFIEKHMNDIMQKKLERVSIDELIEGYFEDKVDKAISEIVSNVLGRSTYDKKRTIDAAVSAELKSIIATSLRQS